MCYSYSSPPKDPYFEVNVSIFLKDSYSLYDYKTKQSPFRQEQFFVNYSSKVHKEITTEETYFDSQNLCGLTVAFVAEIEISRQNSFPVFKVKARSASQHFSQFAAGPKSYLVVRDHQINNSLGYALKAGSLIKLGKVQFQVVQINNSEQMHSIRNRNQQQETNRVVHINKNKPLQTNISQKTQISCRICLCQQQSKDDPMVSPCNCKGTCSWMHVSCLKSWIQNKMKKQAKGTVISYNLSKLECQLCKSSLPQTIQFDQDSSEEIVPVQRPNQPYIMLQSISDKEIKQDRVLYMIPTQEGHAPLKIGRSIHSSVKLSDLSVSRKHAEIVYKQKQFYIVDAKARFGTLVQFDQEFTLRANEFIRIQCGKSVYEFKAMLGALDD